MGGIGTFELGSQFPDLFARAQTTARFETNNDVLASVRNLPVRMWNASPDELKASDYGQTANKLSSRAIATSSMCTNRARTPSAAW
jgi:hypothetical protein